MYGGKILHADACRLCVTHGLGLMLVGIIITIYFHPIQHHISANELHLTKGNKIHNFPSTNIFTV